MMTSSKQRPSVHSKYYFLKVNIKDYYSAKFQVYIIFSFREKIGGGYPPFPKAELPPALPSPQYARVNSVNNTRKINAKTVVKMLRRTCTA